MTFLKHPAAALIALTGVACMAAAMAVPARQTHEPAKVAAPLFEQPAADTPNLTGKWAMTRRITHLLTSDGKEPPLNAAGKAAYEKRQAGLHTADKAVDPINACLMHGTPRLLYAPYPFLILQTTHSVNFVHEVNHTFRIIYWDEHLPEDPDPDYLGYSIARFDGRTLVIDTIGLNDRTWLDYSGLPHGEKLKVEERYTLTNPNTIEGSITLTDPDYYTAAWTTNFTLHKQPGMQIKENVCTDTHRM